MKEGSEHVVNLTTSFVKEGTELVAKFSTSLCIHAKVEEDKKNSETVSPFSKDAKA